MSWNFTLAGRTKSVIKDEVVANPRLPPFVKDVLCAAIDSFPEGKSFVIESAGHLDSNGGNLKFNIKTQKVFIEGDKHGAT